LARSLIESLVKKSEGGEMCSRTLRRIYAEYHGVTIGLYSYGCFAPGRIPPGTVIGRYCSFAEGVKIFNANHPMERRSLHPFFYNPRLGIVPRETIVRGTIVIGHDVWIGHNAIITPRVSSIGNSAVIGAGAVVTRDVPAYAVVAGNPARIVRHRFDDRSQQEIEASRWWEHSIEELRETLDSFLEPVAHARVDQAPADVASGRTPVS